MWLSVYQLENMTCISSDISIPRRRVGEGDLLAVSWLNLFDDDMM